MKLKAIIYDFDGTLTPNANPVFEILELSGMQGGTENEAFRAAVQTMMQRDRINIYEAMIRVIIDTVRQAGLPLNDDNCS